MLITYFRIVRTTQASARALRAALLFRLNRSVYAADAACISKILIAVFRFNLLIRIRAAAVAGISSVSVRQAHGMPVANACERNFTVSNKRIWGKLTSRSDCLWDLFIIWACICFFICTKFVETTVCNCFCRGDFAGTRICLRAFFVARVLLAKMWSGFRRSGENITRSIYSIFELCEWVSWCACGCQVAREYSVLYYGFEWHLRWSGG